MGEPGTVTDAPIDTWYGITTDSEGRRDLGDIGLTGGIPPGIGTTLEVLGERTDYRRNRCAYDPGERDPAVLDLGGPIMRGLAPGRPEDPLLDALPDLAGRRNGVGRARHTRRNSRLTSKYARFRPGRCR